MNNSETNKSVDTTNFIFKAKCYEHFAYVTGFPLVRSQDSDVKGFVCPVSRVLHWIHIGNYQGRFGVQEGLILRLTLDTHRFRITKTAIGSLESARIKVPYEQPEDWPPRYELVRPDACSYELNVLPSQFSEAVEYIVAVCEARDAGQIVPPKWPWVCKGPDDLKEGYLWTQEARDQWNTKSKLNN